MYDRPTHFYNSGDAVRIIDAVYNREPLNAFLLSEDQKYQKRMKWKYCAELATSAVKLISQTLDEWHPGEVVAAAVYQGDVTLLVTLIDIYEALNKVLQFITSFGSWIPYVGQVAVQGRTIIDTLLLVLGPMPSYHRDEFGQIVLDL